MEVGEEKEKRGDGRDQKSEEKWSCKANICSIYYNVDTHTKSSSDPSPFPAVMSLADWLSLAFSSPPALLLLPKSRVFRDLSLDFLRPNRD